LTVLQDTHFKFGTLIDISNY